MAVTRRDFLAVGASAAAGVALGNPLLADGPPTPGPAAVGYGAGAVANLAVR